MKNIIKKSLNKLGYKIVSLAQAKKLSPPELSGAVQDIINEIISQNLTMTPVERLSDHKIDLFPHIVDYSARSFQNTFSTDKLNDV